MMRALRVIAPVLALVAVAAPAAAAGGDGEAADSSRAVSYSASLIGYLFDGGDDYLVPIFYADAGRLHLEARYQYEGLRTASLWGGATWSGGSDLTWQVTPMAGIVFGDADGAAPGLEGELAYGAFEWYAEAEYVFDFGDREDNFFYMWSEWSFYPRESWRVGLVGQRTRAYESDLEVDRGPLAGAFVHRFSFTIYAFNLDRDAPFVAVQAGAEF